MNSHVGIGVNIRQWEGYDNTGCFMWHCEDRVVLPLASTISPASATRRAQLLSSRPEAVRQEAR